MSPPEDLSSLNPTGRFTDRAADYRRYRPDYPAAAIDAVLDGLGEPASLRAADIGAGTGISSRQLADRGVRVTAIEPNAEMRAAADAHPRVTFRAGTAEATGLPDGAVELALAAQAFHWFRAGDAVRELHRILTPGGRLAVVWNHRDHADPLTRGYIQAIHAVQGEHPAERAFAFDPAVLTGGGFDPPDRVDVVHEQPLDRAGLVGRATSASYVPRQGPGFERLRQLLDALFERFAIGGLVRLRYVTAVHRARRR